MDWSSQGEELLCLSVAFQTKWAIHLRGDHLATHLKQAVLSHLCQLLKIFCNACDFLVFGNFAFARVAEQEKKIVSRNKNKSFSCFVLSWIWMSVEIEASPAQFFKIVVQSELTFPFAGVKLENFWFSQKSRHMHATALGSGVPWESFEKSPYLLGLAHYTLIPFMASPIQTRSKGWP